MAAAAKRSAALAEEVGAVYVYHRRPVAGAAGAGAGESETLQWALVQTLEPASGEDRDAFGCVFPDPLASGEASLRVREHQHRREGLPSSTSATVTAT